MDTNIDRSLLEEARQCLIDTMRERGDYDIHIEGWTLLSGTPRPVFEFQISFKWKLNSWEKTVQHTTKYVCLKEDGGWFVPY